MCHHRDFDFSVEDVHALSFATTSDLQRISAAWRTWADAPDGWFLVPHGEILCRA